MGDTTEDSSESIMLSSNQTECLSMADHTPYDIAYQDKRVHTGFIVLYSLTVCLALFINFFLIAAIACHRYLHSVRSFFLISLFVSDLLVTITIGIVNPVVLLSKDKDWLFGKTACQVVPFAMGISVYISSFILTAIALDRYVMIVTPNAPPIRARQAIGISFALWILSAALSAPPMFFQALVQYTGPNGTEFCGEFCIENWREWHLARKIYGIVAIALQFLGPLAIIIWCYAKMMSTLNDLLKRRMDRCLMKESRRKAVIRQHQHTTRLLIAMVGVFVMSWLPQNAINVMHDLGLKIDAIHEHQSLVSLIIHWIVLSSTIWNPLLYAGLNEQVRQGLLDMIPAKLSSVGLPWKNQEKDQKQDVAHQIRARLGSLPINDAHQTLRQAVAKHFANNLEAVAEGSTIVPAVFSQDEPTLYDSKSVKSANTNTNNSTAALPTSPFSAMKRTFSVKERRQTLNPQGDRPQIVNQNGQTKKRSGSVMLPGTMEMEQCIRNNSVKLREIHKKHRSKLPTAVSTIAENETLLGVNDEANDDALLSENSSLIFASTNE